jgi:hypothetical protein
MRYVNRAAFPLLLMLGVCLAVGCSDKSTNPENHPPPSTSKHLWSQRFGDGSAQFGEAVAVDASGNVIVTGYFEGTVDFGGGALASAGGVDIFVAKFGPDGTHLWSKRFGDGSDQIAYAIAADASGNVFVTGSFSGAVDFGGGALTSAGYFDIFVAKFGPDGTHLWSKRFGDWDFQEACAVAVDASGNVIITGHFESYVDFGGGWLECAGAPDIFVVKFGPDGAHLWSKRFGDGGSQLSRSVAVDASGNVFITGFFWGTFDFGGDALTCAGREDIFIAKFGSDGAHLWSKRFGDWDYQEANAVAVDAAGNVIVTGWFFGTVDFGGGVLTSADSMDIFVAAFGSDGAHRWSKRFGDEDDQEAKAIAVDALGNVVVTGSLEGTVDFGGGAARSAGAKDIFIAKFRSDGAYLWSERFGDGSDQMAYAIATDNEGNALVAGYFAGAVDFGGGALTSAGGYDIFLAKFGP